MKLRILTAAVIVGMGVTGGLGAQQTPPVRTGKPASKAKKPAATKPQAAKKPRRTMSFDELMAEMMKPRPYPKNVIVRIDKTHAYPHPALTNWKMIIVKEEGDTVWMTPLPPENPESILHKMWLDHQRAEAFLLQYRKHAPKGKLLDFYKEVVPPPFEDGLHFVKAKTDLPAKGLWQMNVAFGDMNGDGHLDVILPPERKGVGVPTIYLGDGHGGLKLWRNVRWNKRVPFDYGGIAVSDFNRDGHQDVVLAIHFKKQYVFYGDGQGHFDRFSQLPSPDPRLTSRAVTVADFNGDGWPDLAFEAELNVDMTTEKKIDKQTVWIVENQQGKRWRLRDQSLPSFVFADRIASGDLNRDGKSDLVLSSNLQGWRDLLLLNQGSWKWGGENIDEILSAAINFDVKPMPSGGKFGQSLVAAFTEWAKTADLSGGSPKVEARTGLIQYVYYPASHSFTSHPIILDTAALNSFWRVAVGDVNGDGRPDLAVARKQGQILIFVATADGGFVQEESPELAIMGRPMDLQLEDLDSDGLDDLVVMAANDGKNPGGVALWLSRKNH